MKTKTTLQKAHDVAAEYAKALDRHAKGPNADKQHASIEYYVEFCRDAFPFKVTPAIIRQAKQLVHIYRSK